MSIAPTPAQGGLDPARPGSATDGGGQSMFARLSIMMLLEFIVFGAWFATLGLVLATYEMPQIIGLACGGGHPK